MQTVTSHGGVVRPLRTSLGIAPATWLSRPTARVAGVAAFSSRRWPWRGGRFDGGTLTSDGGAVLLREVGRRTRTASPIIGVRRGSRRTRLGTTATSIQTAPSRWTQTSCWA